MSLLPTAHAGQSFGSRRIDFFTVSGEVSTSDAGSGRITDGDGIDHDVRLLERTSALAKGDSATVLRVQSGPNRRSRPVAIVNHSRALWMRAAPDATSILARSGVTRTLNWWLSVLALALVAIAVAWPSLHSFLTELNGAMMSGLPAFDIYAQLGAPLPELANWRLETALSPGLFDGIAALGFVPMEQLTEWGLAFAVTGMALIAFFARSWRLVYVPALAVLCVFAGAILGNPVVSLAMIGGAVLLFVIGGFINRVRDGGRFNARIERLAEYVLRHPPEEGVRTSEPVRTGTIAPEPLAAAAAATAIAAASAVAEGDDSAVAQDAASADDTPATNDNPAEGGPNGEIAADSDDLEAAAEVVEDKASPAEPAEFASNGEVAAETADEAEPADERAIPARPQVGQAETDDDDLPSLEAVAAAAALSNVERTGPSGTSTTALDDERTMAVAAPPPMPAIPEAVTVESPAQPVAAAPEPATPAAERLVTETLIAAPLPIAGSDDTATETPADASQTDVADQAIEVRDGTQTSTTDDQPGEAPSIDESAGAESQDIDDSVEPAKARPADIDDPMIEDDGDPMVEKASGDFAPGAPEIELDQEPAK